MSHIFGAGFSVERENLLGCSTVRCVQDISKKQLDLLLIADNTYSWWKTSVNCWDKASKYMILDDIELHTLSETF